MMRFINTLCILAGAPVIAYGALHLRDEVREFEQIGIATIVVALFLANRAMDVELNRSRFLPMILLLVGGLFAGTQAGIALDDVNPRLLENGDGMTWLVIVGPALVAVICIICFAALISRGSPQGHRPTR